MKQQRTNNVGRPGRLLHILLVGYQDQDNLGLRYLISAVTKAGHRASITTYQSDPVPLLAKVQELQPDVIGFSLIFQYMAPDFIRVIETLRENGVAAHITMGGHYPSFEFEQVLNQSPGLDSIVRFEGEETLTELLNCLGSGSDWRTIAGIACRTGDGKVVSLPLREPIADLDILPWPDRASIDYEGHPLSTASLLGSRGCPWNCSFCSIRPFYEAQGGKLRRLRDPRSIVKEIEYLYRNRNVSVFLFQDDDFLATGRRARKWATDIVDMLAIERLVGKIAFKISCRSDEVREDIIERLVDGGLTHVYLGVESGDEQGLANMNKMLGAEAHVEAGNILRKFELSYDFGFMLLEPYSSLDSIRTNIDFLDSFVGDGWSVATFCRMLPYAGTPVKSRLEAEGRLVGTAFEPDYLFLDRKLDIFYQWMLRTFYERNFTSHGLCHVLRALLFEAQLKLPSASPVSTEQLVYLRYITAVCNRMACYTLRSALDYIENTPYNVLENEMSYLDGLTKHESQEESRLMSELVHYYQWVHPEYEAVQSPATHSFDKSWTFEGGRESIGIGAA